jgi:hypothetical protein
MLLFRAIRGWNACRRNVCQEKARIFGELRPNPELTRHLHGVAQSDRVRSQEKRLDRGCSRKLGLVLRLAGA